MKPPIVRGVIRRRILVNFRVEPRVMQQQLPALFRPKLVGGVALAGICLVRVEQLRPFPVPAALGLSSDNAAHRVAVEWDGDEGAPREGVYIPRRDSSSLGTHLMGGRLFPGLQQRADFNVVDDEHGIQVSMRSRDGQVSIALRAHAATSLPPRSCFGSLADASDFFAAGSLGYSATNDPARLDGLRLVTRGWHIEPLAVDEAHSSFFADPGRFPPGSVELDSALLMRDVEHEWHPAGSMCVPSTMGW